MKTFFFKILPPLLSVLTTMMAIVGMFGAESTHKVVAYGFMGIISSMTTLYYFIEHEIRMLPFRFMSEAVDLLTGFIEHKANEMENEKKRSGEAPIDVELDEA